MEILATALDASSRQTLAVAAAILVTLTLGVIVQGRVVDNEVQPPGNLKSYFVAVEILAGAIFFAAAAFGVYGCLYFLARDLEPEGTDRAIIENALLTTAIVAGILTIARRALPAYWPADDDAATRPQPVAVTRLGIELSVIAALFAAAGGTFLFDTWSRLAFVGVMAALVVAVMMLRVRFQTEPILAAWLGRRAWTRISTCPVEDGLLDGAADLPVGFAPVSQDPDDLRLWLSATGVNRLRRLLRERYRHSAHPPVLRWQGRGCREVLWTRGGLPMGSPWRDALLIRRNDARLFLVEPTLGLIRRLEDKSEPAGTPGKSAPVAEAESAPPEHD